MLKPLLLALVLVASSSTVTVQAQIEPKIPAPVTKGLESFMFVGNSFFYFNNGLPSYVSKLASAAPESHRPKFDFTMITIGGAEAGREALRDGLVRDRATPEQAGEEVGQQRAADVHGG